MQYGASGPQSSSPTHMLPLVGPPDEDSSELDEPSDVPAPVLSLVDVSMLVVVLSVVSGELVSPSVVAGAVVLVPGSLVTVGAIVVSPLPVLLPLDVSVDDSDTSLHANDTTKGSASQGSLMVHEYITLVLQPAPQSWRYRFRFRARSRS